MKTVLAALLMLAVAVVPAVAATAGYGYTNANNPPVAHGANS